MKSPDERRRELDGGPNLTVLKPKASRFRPLLASQLPKPTTPRLVHKLLGEGSLNLLYGDWGSGKSFVGVDLACHVAAGESWRGRPVSRGAVVYIAGEAAPSIGRRVSAWLLRHGYRNRAEPPIGVAQAAPNLLEPGQEELAEAIVEAAAFAKHHGEPLRLVVIDTLHAAAPGCEESARDFGRILAAVREIVNKTGAAVLLVHHSGKDSSRGARGSNSLEAGCDVVLEVREEETSRSILVRKVRDGEPPELEPFVIDPVTLGHEEGEPVVAGVAVAVEPRTPSANDPRREEARKRRAAGDSFRTIAQALGVGKATVHRWLS
jgi:predicted ATP-dependent serine protease